MKKLLGVLALLAITIAGGIGLAQTIAVPQVTIVNPTDLFQIVPYGLPRAGNQYAVPAQITSQSGYYKAAWVVTGTPAAGLPYASYTYQFGNSTSFFDVTQSGAVSALYVYLAQAPSDGDRDCMYAQGGTWLLGLYLSSPGTGQTLDNGVTALTAATQVCYLYSASNTTWDRN